MKTQGWKVENHAVSRTATSITAAFLFPLSRHHYIWLVSAVSQQLLVSLEREVQQDLSSVVLNHFP